MTPGGRLCSPVRGATRRRGGGTEDAGVGGAGPGAHTRRRERGGPHPNLALRAQSRGSGRGATLPLNPRTWDEVWRQSGRHTSGGAPASSGQRWGDQQTTRPRVFTAPKGSPHCQGRTGGLEGGNLTPCEKGSQTALSVLHWPATGPLQPLCIHTHTPYTPTHTPHTQAPCSLRVHTHTRTRTQAHAACMCTHTYTHIGTHKACC